MSRKIYKTNKNLKKIYDRGKKTTKKKNNHRQFGGDFKRKRWFRYNREGSFYESEKINLWLREEYQGLSQGSWGVYFKRKHDNTSGPSAMFDMSGTIEELINFSPQNRDPKHDINLVPFSDWLSLVGKSSKGKIEILDYMSKQDIKKKYFPSWSKDSFDMTLEKLLEHQTKVSLEQSEESQLILERFQRFKKINELFTNKDEPQLTFGDLIMKLNISIEDKLPNNLITKNELGNEKIFIGKKLEECLNYNKELDVFDKQEEEIVESGEYFLKNVWICTDSEISKKYLETGRKFLNHKDSINDYDKEVITTLSRSLRKGASSFSSAITTAMAHPGHTLGATIESAMEGTTQFLGNLLLSGGSRKETSGNTIISGPAFARMFWDFDLHNHGNLTLVMKGLLTSPIMNNKLKELLLYEYKNVDQITNPYLNGDQKKFLKEIIKLILEEKLIYNEEIRIKIIKIPSMGVNTVCGKIEVQLSDDVTKNYDSYIFKELDRFNFENCYLVGERYEWASKSYYDINHNFWGEHKKFYKGFINYPFSVEERTESKEYCPNSPRAQFNNHFMYCSRLIRYIVDNPIQFKGIDQISNDFETKRFNFMNILDVFNEFIDFFKNIKSNYLSYLKISPIPFPIFKHEPLSLNIHDLSTEKQKELKQKLLEYRSFKDFFLENLHFVGVKLCFTPGNRSKGKFAKIAWRYLKPTQENPTLESEEEFTSESEAARQRDRFFRNPENKVLKEDTIFNFKEDGVSWIKQKKKWQARIMIDGKEKHLGYYPDEKEATRIYYEQAALLGKPVNERFPQNFKTEFNMENDKNIELKYWLPMSIKTDSDEQQLLVFLKSYIQNVDKFREKYEDKQEFLKEIMKIMKLKDLNQEDDITEFKKEKFRDEQHSGNKYIDHIIERLVSNPFIPQIESPTYSLYEKIIRNFLTKFYLMCSFIILDEDEDKEKRIIELNNQSEFYDLSKSDKPYGDSNDLFKKDYLINKINKDCQLTQKFYKYNNPKIYQGNLLVNITHGPEIEDDKLFKIKVNDQNDEKSRVNIRIKIITDFRRPMSQSLSKIQYSDEIYFSEKKSRFLYFCPVYKLYKEIFNPGKETCLNKKIEPAENRHKCIGEENLTNDTKRERECLGGEYMLKTPEEKYTVSLKQLTDLQERCKADLLEKQGNVLEDNLGCFGGEGFELKQSSPNKLSLKVDYKIMMKDPYSSEILDFNSEIFSNSLRSLKPEGGFNHFKQLYSRKKRVLNFLTGKNKKLKKKYKTSKKRTETSSRMV